MVELRILRVKSSKTLHVGGLTHIQTKNKDLLQFRQTGVVRQMHVINTPWESVEIIEIDEDDYYYDELLEKN